LPSCIWSGNYMRDVAVVAGWEGADCGAGPGTGGQCQLVPNPGGGSQVMGRELREDGARESWAEVYVVRGWGKPGQGWSGVGWTWSKDQSVDQGTQRPEN